MRLPNSYGSVYKLSGKRRNPWAVRITVGWDTDFKSNKARQRFKYIGYYHTRQEAMAALAAYRENPYDLDAAKDTFADVYQKWSAVHFQEITPSATRTWISAYKHSAPLHNMLMRDIRPFHMESVINDADVGASTKMRMKSMYNLMFRFALKADIVTKNYADLVDTVKADPPKIERIPFSEDEICTLFANQNIQFVNMILVGIYSGWRPQELSVLKVADVDPDQLTMFGGLKTAAGKNRIVPVHPAIEQIVRDQYAAAVNVNSPTLFFDMQSQTGKSMTYDKYRSRFNKVMAALGMHHRPHDTRHTFITLAKQYGMDEYIIKRIVGHEISDVTEKIYTHRDIEQLHNEIKKIKAPV